MGLTLAQQNKHKREKKNSLKQLNHIRESEQQCHITFYYPLYNGFSFPDVPPVFRYPSHAAAWAISRFKRDGLSNIWEPDKYPDFLQFVGTISSSISSPILNKWSSFTNISRKLEIEQTFFSEVVFFRVTDTTPFIFHYARLPDDVFTEIKSCFKSMSDFQSSAGSIFKNKCVLRISRDIDIVHHIYSHQLENKMVHTSTFMKMEDCFKHVVEHRTFANYGEKCISILYCNICFVPSTDNWIR